MELETLFDSKITAKDSSDDLSAYKLTKTKLHVQLAGIGVSIIDFTPVELCYISIDNINFEQTSCQAIMGGNYQKNVTLMNLKINNFQIDATQNKIFPVLLGPKKPYRNIERLFRVERGNTDLSKNIKPIL